MLSSLNFPQGTDEARMNTNIKWILSKYEGLWLIIQASSGLCSQKPQPVFSYPTYHFSTRIYTTDKYLTQVST